MNISHLESNRGLRLVHYLGLLFMALGAVFVIYIDSEQDKMGLGTPPVMEKYVITKMYNIIDSRNAMMLRSGSMLGTRDDADFGLYLVDQRGMTLYTYTGDEPGVSNCYGDCTDKWKILWTQGNIVLGDGVTGELGIIERNDGPWQVTYNNTPLYFFKDDSKPGDLLGNGVSGKWYAVKP